MPCVPRASRERNGKRVLPPALLRVLHQASQRLSTLPRAAPTRPAECHRAQVCPRSCTKNFPIKKLIDIRVFIFKVSGIS